jgi:hypothetical protein
MTLLNAMYEPWQLLFYALKLRSKYGMFNEKFDALVVFASTLQPCKDLLEEGTLEIMFRPSILDNFEHWKIFDNDSQIIRFMNNLKNSLKMEFIEGIEYQEELRKIK